MIESRAKLAGQRIGAHIAENAFVKHRAGIVRYTILLQLRLS